MHTQKCSIFVVSFHTSITGAFVMLTRDAINIAANTSIRAIPKFELIGNTIYPEIKKPRIANIMKLPFNGANFIFFLEDFLRAILSPML